LALKGLGHIRFYTFTRAARDLEGRKGLSFELFLLARGANSQRRGEEKKIFQGQEREVI